MTDVRESIEINASPDVVWSIIGDPGSLAAWHPAIAASPMSDKTRLCSLEGGGEVQEPILEHSDSERFYTYTISVGPFNMSDYFSRVAVEASPNGTQLVWTGSFEAGDPGETEMLKDVFSGVYRSGIESAKVLAESQTTD
jgi:Polyketide cyclase / dehydrase and lipid transport